MSRIRQRNFTRAERALMYIGVLSGKSLDWINEQLVHSQTQLGQIERLLPESSYKMLRTGYASYFVKQVTFTTGEDNSPFSLTIDQVDWDLITETIVAPAAVSTLASEHSEDEEFDESSEPETSKPFGEKDPLITIRPVYHWEICGESFHESELEDWLDEQWEDFQGIYENVPCIKLVRTKIHSGKLVRHETWYGHRHAEIRQYLAEDWPQKVYACKRHRDQLQFLESFLKEKGIF